MTREIAIDLSRLLIGGWRSTPRGIDRAEMRFARHFLSHWNGPCSAILPTMWGIRRFERDHSLRGLEHIERAWRDYSGAPDDGLAQIQLWLSGQMRLKRLDLRQEHLGASLRSFCSDVGLSWGRAAATSVQRDAIYLNIGHIALSRGFLLNWLKRRRDIKPVFFIHDVIPLEHPEFVTSREHAFFQRLIANTAHHAKGLIVSTHAVERSLGKFMHPLPPVLVCPHPVASLFMNAAGSADPHVHTAPPYFITCGQLDKRKNHRVLLEAWKTIARSGGGLVPKLLIVGIPGSASDDVRRHLDEWDPQRNHVLEIAGLPTPTLIELLRQTRALLMPSFAEGFGLPILEALTVGTPVIASNIAVHREVGRDGAAYVDPHKPQSWISAIQRHVAGPEQFRKPDRTPRSAWTNKEYFLAVEQFLAKL